MMLFEPLQDSDVRQTERTATLECNSNFGARLFRLFGPICGSCGVLLP
jgi:hypothetical protein